MLHALPPPVGAGRSGLGGLLEDGQGPAPAGEFAGDGDIGDRGFLAAQVEAHPASVQATVAGVAAGPDRGRGQFPPVAHGLAGQVAGLVVPGGLDEQSADVGVAGLGDRALRPQRAG